MSIARRMRIVIAVVLVGATVFVCVWSSLPPLHLDKVRAYLPIFQQESANSGISLSRLLAIANVESDFEPSAVSTAGACGIMQLMPATARWIAERNNLAYDDAMLGNPRYNVHVAALYLTYLATKFDGDWVCAAYNAGEGVVTQWLYDGVSIEDIPYAETREYVRKVRKLTKRYRRRGYSS